MFMYFMSKRNSIAHSTSIAGIFFGKYFQIFHDILTYPDH